MQNFKLNLTPETQIQGSVFGRFVRNPECRNLSCHCQADTFGTVQRKYFQDLRSITGLPGHAGHGFIMGDNIIHLEYLGNTKIFQCVMSQLCQKRHLSCHLACDEYCFTGKFLADIVLFVILSIFLNQCRIVRLGRDGSDLLNQVQITVSHLLERS